MATLVTGRMVEDQSITLNDLTQSSGALMFRNKIINGNFDIWQRDTSFSGIASEAYHADRWNVAYNGSGGTRIITRENFDLGQTLVPYEPTYFLRWNQSVAGTGATFNFLRQKIESVRTFANKQITVSFYAKAASPIAIAVYGLQWYGSGGSPSSETFTNYSTGLNVTTSWQKFTVNLTVPSIAGKTLGTNNDDRLEITFGLPLNTTFTFDIAQVQVEEGSVATPFEQRPIGMELQLCQRYYEKGEGYISGYAINGIQYANLVQFKATKRRVPNLSYSSTTISGATFWDIRDATTESAKWYFVRTGSDGGFIWYGIWTANAEL